MTTELERTLARELQEVADGLRVPPMPSVAGADDHRRGMPRLWQPMLVAAAVVLVLGVVALVLSQQGDGRPQPAPSPSPSVVRSPRPTAVADGAPTIPYVLDQRLHVDGAEVPGTWAFVESRGGVWLGQQVDGSWWTGGPGVDPGRIDAQIDQPPAISPDGRYVAFVDTSGGAAHLTGFDTQPAGEGFGQAPVELPSTEDGVALRVRAVTNDGDVIVQGTRTSLMWRALHQDQQAVVDLSRSAPGQVVLQGTPAGLVVVDGAEGAVDATDTAPYLATVSPEGQLGRVAALPTYDALDISPGGTWLVRSPAGTLGGEVTGVAQLRARAVGGGDDEVLRAPGGGLFANGSWAWEDDENLVAVLLPGDSADGGARLARCNAVLAACRPIPRPGAGHGASRDPGTAATAGTPDGTAPGTLDAVVRAVAADDRTLLADRAVIGDADWDQLRSFAAGGSGAPGTCRDNGGGTKDCEIDFDADPATVYYAILGPAKNAYGWRITYVGVGGA